MDADAFDFIVAGAGSAGAAVAARLSENGRHSVLLLEAGPPDRNPWIHIPLGYPKTFVDPKVNWKFESTPQAALGNRQLYVPRGKTLGGTSSINGMVYMRGHARDYDGWRQRGCTGWDYDSVLPFFRKAQNQERGESEFHGTGGPLNVADQPKSPLAEAMIAAAGQAGVPPTPDFNGARQEGAGYFQTTTGARRRWSSARAYLKPAANRQNLEIRTLCQATRVLIQDGRATGVEYQSPRGRETAQARREVIICGGAYGSPQLLQLSGLGPAAHLQELGIPVIADMPAVGAHLHDHFCTYLMWRCTQPVTLNMLDRSWPKKIWAALQYGIARTGPMAVNGIRAGIFTRSDQRLERPDLQFNLMEWSTLERSKDAVRGHPFHAFTLGLVHLAPDGRGTVRLASPDPLAPPAISFNFLATDYDMRAMVEGARFARRVVEQPALAGFAGAELVPGPDYGDDLERFIRDTGTTNHHPAGSCAMGPEPGGSVVDPRLRVHGIKGLRVADASIMPSVVAGNTNAPSIMIGEKCAAMVLEEAG